MRMPPRLAPQKRSSQPIPSPPSVCHPVSSLKPIHLISRVSSRLSSWIGRMRRQNRAMPSCLKCPFWRSDPGGAEVADQMVRTRWRPQLADAPAPRPWTHQLEADSERFRLLLVWRFAWAGALKRVRGHGTDQSRDGDLDHVCIHTAAAPILPSTTTVLVIYSSTSNKCQICDRGPNDTGLHRQENFIRDKHLSPMLGC